jgi:deoxyribonuclease V
MVMSFLIAILDVAYTDDAAGVGCVLAETWAAPSPSAELAKHVPGAPQPYEPGNFYKRELPLLLAAIQDLEVEPVVFVIDGYVWLGPDKPGLGARLFEHLGSCAAVIGVAKSAFSHDMWSAVVHRGQSRRPLLVTSAGIGTAEAAALVSGMHGEHRIPTLLQRADRLARAAARRGEAAPVSR